MKKLSFVLAASLALAVAGCDDLFGGDEVTVTVTGRANVRDAATTEGSNVLTTLDAGTQLKGKWVTSDTDNAERWFAYERDGKTAYIWEGNLESETRATNLDKEESTDNKVKRQEILLTDGLYSLESKCDLYKKYAVVPVNCIDKNQYEEICKRVDGSTKSAARDVIFHAAFNGKIDLKAGEFLIENNQIYNFQSNWDAEKRKCKYKFVLEGMFGGNSYRSSYIDGVAHTFKVEDGDDPYIYSGEPDYNF